MNPSTKNNNLKKVQLSLFVLALLAILYLGFSDIPLRIAQHVFGFKINYHEAFNLYIQKLSITGVIFLIALYLVVTNKFWKIIRTIISYGEKIAIKIENILNLKVWFTFSFIYLIILFGIAIVHYDLGIDEAWYLHYAENFASQGVPFYTINEEIQLVDFMTMLPHYITYAIADFFIPINLYVVKTIATILSLTGLILIAYTIINTRSTSLSLLTLSFIILQPGFGFITSSFFGEVLSIGLLFLGMYFILKEDGKIILGILSVVLAIHTKFQLLPLVLFTLLLLSFFYHDKKLLRNTGIVLFLTILLMGLRLLPFLTHEGGLVMIIKQFYHLSTSYHDNSYFFLKLERLQLLNRFFPLSFFLILVPVSFPLLKNKFEKFVFIFGIVTILYWTFFFRFVTYRHLFLGIIPFCYLAAIVVQHLFAYLTQKISLRSTLIVKLFSIFSFILFFTYGTSTNLIYAWRGYNDGVQFDMDGYQNQLFGKIEHDNSQQLFYHFIQSNIDSDIAIYTESPHVSKFYLKNDIYQLNRLPNQTSFDDPIYIIISREFFPNQIDEGFKQLKALQIEFDTVYQHGDFFLLKAINPNNS